MKIVVCHPEFVPAIPFFKRIMAADLCVIQHHVALDPHGPVAGFVYGDRRWFMRVDDSFRLLVDRFYTHAQEDWEHITKGIGHSVLKDLARHITPNVVRTNMALIQDLCGRLGVTTPVLADEPNPLRGVDRLIYLCRKHKADTFLAMEGAYLDAAQFKAARINVETYSPEARDRRHVLDLL